MVDPGEWVEAMLDDMSGDRYAKEYDFSVKKKTKGKTK